MKLYGYVVLLVLILYTSADYQKENSDLRRELKAILQDLGNQNDFTKRLHPYNQDSRLFLDSFPETKRHSSYEKRANDTTGPTTPLLNVTIIQRGFYFARVVVNFLRNGLQDEFETDSTFDGTNRVFRLQKSPADVITYLRIRFHVVGSHKDFGDFQVIQPDGEKLCFVLSGTAFSPVYSICAPDEDYSRK